MLTLADADLPSTFRAADADSLAGQRAAVHWRRAQLCLLLIAAVAGVGSWQVGNGYDVAATIATLAFAAALVCELARATSIPERAWYRGRAGAESIKTLAWKYAVGGHPFEAGTPGADELFLTAVRGITQALSDVDWTRDGDDHPQQITPTMHAVRLSPLSQRKELYRQHRIANQRRWYASKASRARRSSRRWSAVITVATSLGLAAAVAKVFGALDVQILGLASSAAAAAAAWTQFRQHDALASAYTVAARELLLVDERLASCPDEDTWGRLVEESEEAVSREHTMWAAKRDVRISV